MDIFYPLKGSVFAGILMVFWISSLSVEKNLDFLDNFSGNVELFKENLFIKIVKIKT